MIQVAPSFPETLVQTSESSGRAIALRRIQELLVHSSDFRRRNCQSDQRCLYQGPHASTHHHHWDKVLGVGEGTLARARISAQETTPGQVVSSWDFAASITSKPLKRELGGAVFSVDGPSMRIDASQPLTKQSWKNIRSKPGATVGLARTAD
ncbi:hypothetical protein Ccrd_004511 [Cynara cardunculus var. scolymus]|uniref:Uncharacterized protein n=1 Tax=Cynara cardunculus var. scolymus TaxID=59895 RepID=A0A103XMF3_CYNCS|nr:hypothetical protein Ccrd_004511 [Cynara cardunculus var. scolymus]